MAISIAFQGAAAGGLGVIRQACAGAARIGGILHFFRFVFRRWYRHAAFNVVEKFGKIPECNVGRRGEFGIIRVPAAAAVIGLPLHIL